MTHEGGLSSNGGAAELPAGCESLLELSPVPMAELEGDLHLVRYANPALCRLLDKSPEVLAGRPFAEALRVDDSCLAVLDRVYRTGEAATHTDRKHPTDRAAYWSYAMWPVLDAGQQPAGVMVQVIVPTLLDARAGAINEALLISSVYQHEQTETAQKLNDRLHVELAERRRVEEALRQAHAGLQRAFEFDQAVMASMSEGLYTIDREGLLTSMNPAAERLFGWRFDELRGQSVHEKIHHHHSDTAFPAGECPLLRGIRAGESLTGQEDEFIRSDGSYFPVVCSAAPVRDDAGVVGLVVVFRDITEQRRTEKRERTLAQEIAHRNKNLLAIIQAIVSRSLAEKRTPEEARNVIMQRLQAIAKSQTAIESGGFIGATLAEITRLEFEAFSSRIEAKGPEVLLNPRAAQTFSMLLHELATNALKYGALSSPAGKVSVAWSVEPDDAREQFRFRWLEHGGGPVTPPTRQGFGSILIELMAQDLGATARVDFARDGLRCEVDVALSALVPEGTKA